MSEYQAIPGVCSAHARERALERYGENPSAAEWRLAQSDILGGRAMRTKTRTDADGDLCDEYVVRLGSRAARVKFSTLSGVIVTVVPVARRNVVPLSEKRRRVARKAYWKKLRWNESEENCHA